MLKTYITAGEDSPLERCQSLLAAVEKEIHENITQCLCLAKMRIAGVEWEKREDTLSRIGEANLLLGKAVQDLRILVKQFHNLKH